MSFLPLLWTTLAVFTVDCPKDYYEKGHSEYLGPVERFIQVLSTAAERP